MEKSRNRAVGRQVRKMIAAAMAAMLVFTSANVADVNAEETVLAVSENAVTGETGAGVVEAEKTVELRTGKQRTQIWMQKQQIRTQKTRTEHTHIKMVSAQTTAVTHTSLQYLQPANMI